MSRIFTRALDKEELATIIEKTACARADERRKRYYPTFPPICASDGGSVDDIIKRVQRDHELAVTYKSLTPQVEKDLAKVRFDTENITADPCDWYGSVIQGSPHASDFVGFHTLSNGLSFLGVNAGGDWEIPLFFIIYHDGEQLRGYIPEKGNLWNKKTKAAYGNESELAPELEDEIGAQWDDLAFDYHEIENDVLARILYRPKQ